MLAVMSKSQATERLVALLFTDLVDSAKLNARLGDVRFQKVMVRHNQVWRDLSTQHRGRGQRTTGDGFSAMFNQPLDAVRFAMAFHAALERLSDELQLEWEGRPLRLTARAGIHLGNIVAKDQDEPQGLAFGIANRVMSPGLGGQTLMTIASFNIARRSAVGVPTETNLVWLEHGLYSFKGFDEPMTICEVGIEGRSPLRPPPDSEKVKRTVTPDQDETLGWRPAKDSAVPHNPQWILREPLGAGGFGEVWLAENKTLDIERVFKFCFDTVRLRALKRELSIFKLLRGALGEHPNIQRLDDVNIQEPPPYYLMMDYARGGNLASWSESEQYGGIGNIPLGDRLELVAQVADGLGAAHAVGVIHKDVKPGNILIGNEPGRGIQARLADFGIGLVIVPELAERLDIHMTGWEKTDLGYDLGSRTGTRLYTAPELVAGRDPSIQSDIYSLGVVLYQVVVGDFSRPLAEGWKEGIADELLCEDIEACVHGDPKRRLRAAEDLAERLRTLEKRRRDIHDRQVEAERVRVESERRERLIRRLRRVLTVGAIAAPIVIAFVIVIAIAERNEARLRANDAAWGIMTGFVPEPAVALERLKEAEESVRKQFNVKVQKYLRSGGSNERATGARGTLWGDEQSRNAFWATVDDGALWTHGEWLELCQADWPDPQPLMRLFVSKTGGGTASARQKYVAFCLMGQFAKRYAISAEADPGALDACVRALETEEDPGVVAAARWAAQRLGADVTLKSGDRVYVDEVTGLTFVHVPGTERFSPGSPESEVGRWSKNEGKSTTPEPVPDLWVSMTEMTWEQVARLKREDRSKFPEELRDDFASELAGVFEAVPEDQNTWDKIALTSVTFMQAMLISDLFSGLEENRTQNLYRLPSEAEWEYICRADSAASFCFGNNPLYARYFAVCGGEQPSEPFAVAKRMPSFYGVFDMHGNAWELCDTFYRESYDAPEPDLNPLVVRRGGAFYNPALRCRSAQRNWTLWDVADPYTGFRLVLERPGK